MWREPTESDITSVLNAAETMAYKTAVIAPGQDVLRDSITLVVNHCRGYIADNPQNRLAAGVTLPDRVMLSALHLIRVELLTRLKLVVDDDRKDAAKAATRFLERVADGKVTIEQPDDGAPVDTSSAVESIELVDSARRLFTRKTQSGL